MSLSDSILHWLWAPGLEALGRLEAAMASDLERLGASVGRMEGFAGEAVAELGHIRALLVTANQNQAVDLDPIIERVDALADRLDAAVPDAAPVEPPAEEDAEPPVAPV